MKQLVRAVVLSTAAVVLVMATAPGASAGDGFQVWSDANHMGVCDVDNEAGSVRFEDVGEHFYVADHRADGYAVGANVWVGTDFKGTFYNRNGGGTTLHFDRSYPEGASVAVQVFTYKIGHSFRCGEDVEVGTA